MWQLPPEHLYRRDACVTFRKTHEAFGAFSNMADGYPVYINDLRIRYAEALYQACRFPHAPAVQQAILAQASPMAAKMVAKKYAAQTRADWETVRVVVMRWVVQLKCFQHRDRLLALFAETGERPIVEESRRDRFWGAVPGADGETLSGRNILGLLLQEARATLRDTAQAAAPPNFSRAILLGQPMVINQALPPRPAPMAQATQLALTW